MAGPKVSLTRRFHCKQIGLGLSNVIIVIVTNGNYRYLADNIKERVVPRTTKECWTNDTLGTSNFIPQRGTSFLNLKVEGLVTSA